MFLPTEKGLVLSSAGLQHTQGQQLLALARTFVPRFEAFVNRSFLALHGSMEQSMPYDANGSVRYEDTNKLYAYQFSLENLYAFPVRGAQSSFQLELFWKRQELLYQILRCFEFEVSSDDHFEAIRPLEFHVPDHAFNILDWRGTVPRSKLQFALVPFSDS